MTFLKNCWYAAGWSEEFGRTLTWRTIIGEPVLLYRRESGAIAAIGDTCPHRFAPLHKGVLAGDRVQCPYHGLQFDATGACVHNPHGDHAIPRAAAVKRYPVVERDTLIWVWMGDAERANADDIPDFSMLCEPEKYTYTKWLSMRMDINYELIVDNLLDLSHASFLHTDNVGNEALARGIIDVRQEGNTVYSDRVGPNGKPAPVFSNTGACDPDDMVDYWADMRWDPPASFYLDTGIVPAGEDRAHGKLIRSVQILTPETETSTRYIVRLFRNYHRDRPQLTEAIEAAIHQAFTTQDEPMVKNVSDRMAGRDFWSMKPVMLSGDGGAVRARRVLAQLIEKERQEENSRAESDKYPYTEQNAARLKNEVPFKRPAE